MIEQFEDTLSLTLREPIKLGNLEFSTLELSEPNGAQLQAAAKATEPYGDIFTLIAMNASVPPEVAKRMKQRDLERAADFFGHFGSKSTPENSESSQPS